MAPSSSPALQGAIAHPCPSSTSDIWGARWRREDWMHLSEHACPELPPVALVIWSTRSSWASGLILTNAALVGGSRFCHNTLREFMQMTNTNGQRYRIHPQPGDLPANR
eukprot:4416901-Pyramimonas_sp.AAC.1